jgi:hypothetical protein
MSFPISTARLERLSVLRTQARVIALEDEVAELRARVARLEASARRRSSHSDRSRQRPDLAQFTLVPCGRS